MPFPKKEDRYVFTSHAQNKMRYYRLSPSRIERVIRNPTRTETGVAQGTIAVMAPGETKDYTEIWVMYKTEKTNGKRLKIITAWRYPGKSRERDPIPRSVLDEVHEIVDSM